MLSVRRHCAAAFVPVCLFTRCWSQKESPAFWKEVSHFVEMCFNRSNLWGGLGLFCSLFWTVSAPWMEPRRMMCAQGLRSSALLCGKSASKNTVFLPSVCVCVFALELSLTRSLFLKLLAEQQQPFYLQTPFQQLFSFSTGCGIDPLRGDNGALLCVNVEVVCGPRVFVVMDGCSK